MLLISLLLFIVFAIPLAAFLIAKKFFYEKIVNKLYILFLFYVIYFFASIATISFVGDFLDYVVYSSFYFFFCFYSFLPEEVKTNSVRRDICKVLIALFGFCSTACLIFFLFVNSGEKNNEFKLFSDKVYEFSFEGNNYSCRRFYYSESVCTYRCYKNFGLFESYVHTMDLSFDTISLPLNKDDIKVSLFRNKGKVEMHLKSAEEMIYSETVLMQW